MAAPIARKASKLSLALGLTGLLASGLGYMAWSGNLAYAIDENETAAASLPVVQTMTVEEAGLRNWSTFSGRLKAVDEAIIRPLVSGTIQQVLFEDSAYVEAGQELFVIDPRPFQAALQHAEASLASAQSDAALARVEFERADSLASKNTISRSIRDNHENDLKMALAQVESAQAEMSSARLNLDYAHVKAPISGRIGRAEVTLGNVIEAGANAPVLTTVVGTAQLYAEFDVDEATYFKVLRSASASHHAAGQDTDGKAAIPVDIVLEGDADSVYHGHLHSFDNQLDIQSGTIRARALLENADGNLIPGVFASVRLGTANEEPALLVPARAIGVSQDKRFVYVVNGDDRVEYREVALGSAVDTQRIVITGLSKGERVIVNGLQHVSSNMQVEAVPVTETEAASASDVATSY